LGNEIRDCSVEFDRATVRRRAVCAQPPGVPKSNFEKGVTKMKAHIGRSETFGSTDLVERAIHRRAVEAAIWGIPAVNGDLMFQAFRNIGGDFNQICYWSGLLDWKNQTLTPTPH
jgi:hypothetical protein